MAMAKAAAIRLTLLVKRPYKGAGRYDGRGRRSPRSPGVDKVDQVLKVAAGGGRGLGNAAFKSSTNRAA